MNPWAEIGISIRTVKGQREPELQALEARVRTFSPLVKISFHQEGRTVPESYADALAAWEHEKPTVLGRAPFWTLQLEDDALLAPSFETLVPQMLADTQNSGKNVGVVSFYSGRRLVEGEALPDPPQVEYLPGARFLMAQAIAFQTSQVADHNAFMLRFCANRPYATDTATAAWMKERKLKLARAWPSIVQHKLLPSLSGHRPNSNRHSASFRAVYGDV